ncbi:unnamed protein product [Amoebophrya sp. A25]|nr:unnamed protein product [Amoebophrya sp. A25]|eukprot:GSA25T00006284001.1
MRHKSLEPKEQLVAVLLFHWLTRGAVLAVRTSGNSIAGQFGQVVEAFHPFQALRFARMQMLIRWLAWEKKLQKWAQAMEKIENVFGMKKDLQSLVGPDRREQINRKLDSGLEVLEEEIGRATKDHFGWWLFLRSETLKGMAHDIATLRTEHLSKYTAEAANAAAKKSNLLPNRVRYQRGASLQHISLTEGVADDKNAWVEDDAKHIAAISKLSA